MALPSGEGAALRIQPASSEGYEPVPGACVAQQLVYRQRLSAVLPLWLPSGRGSHRAGSRVGEWVGRSAPGLDGARRVGYGLMRPLHASASLPGPDPGPAVGRILEANSGRPRLTHYSIFRLFLVGPDTKASKIEFLASSKIMKINVLPLQIANSFSRHSD